MFSAISIYRKCYILYPVPEIFGSVVPASPISPIEAKLSKCCNLLRRRVPKYVPFIVLSSSCVLYTVIPFLVLRKAFQEQSVPITAVIFSVTFFVGGICCSNFSRLFYFKDKVYRSLLSQNCQFYRNGKHKVLKDS